MGTDSVTFWLWDFERWYNRRVWDMEIPPEEQLFHCYYRLRNIWSAAVLVTPFACYFEFVQV